LQIADLVDLVGGQTQLTNRVHDDLVRDMRTELGSEKPEKHPTSVLVALQLAASLCLLQLHSVSFFLP
jgi:hypothetical protein